MWDLTDTSSVVADLSDLHALDAQGRTLADAGASGPIFIVAPQADTFTLARLYSHYGARTGRMIEALHARSEAWERLGAPEPDYDALRPLLASTPRYNTGAASRRA